MKKKNENKIICGFCKEEIGTDEKPIVDGEEVFCNDCWDWLIELKEE